MNLDAALKQEIRRITRRELKSALDEVRAVMRRKKAEVNDLKQALQSAETAGRRTTATSVAQSFPDDVQFRFLSTPSSASREEGSHTGRIVPATSDQCSDAIQVAKRGGASHATTARTGRLGALARQTGTPRTLGNCRDDE